MIYDSICNCYLINTREDLIQALRFYRIIHIEKHKDVWQLDMVSFSNSPKCYIKVISDVNPCKMYDGLKI